MAKQNIKSLNIKISPGNSKTGKIPSVSLPPIEACGKGNPCTKNCYALKAYRMYPNVKKAWSHNLQLLLSNRDEYFEDIVAYIKIKAPLFFRWHVSGDIYDQDYLLRMIKIAKQFPDIKFLAFTKRLDLKIKSLPQNLNVIASMWPGWKEKKKTKLPRAWFQDGSEDRIPKGAITCSGCCDKCYLCWDLGKDGQVKDVVLLKH